MAQRGAILTGSLALMLLGACAHITPPPATTVDPPMSADENECAALTPFTKGGEVAPAREEAESKARAVCERACDAGGAESCARLAMHLLFPPVEQATEARAMSLFEQSCAPGGGRCAPASRSAWRRSGESSG